jgi:hypothetical protein
VTNTLAFYGTKLIEPVKSFIAQAPADSSVHTLSLQVGKKLFRGWASQNFSHFWYVEVPGRFGNLTFNQLDVRPTKNKRKVGYV